MSSALNFVPWNPQLRITQFLPDFLNMEISMFIINCINLNFFIGCTLINIIVIWHYSQLDVNKCLLVPLWEHMTGQIKDSTNFYFVKPMTLIGLITGIWVMDYLQEEKLIKDSCIKYNHLNMSDSSWMPETWNSVYMCHRLIMRLKSNPYIQLSWTEPFSCQQCLSPRFPCSLYVYLVNIQVQALQKLLLSSWI